MQKYNKILLPFLSLALITAGGHACFSSTYNQRSLRHSSRSRDIVFIGDSITAWFLKDGKSVWDKFYGPLGAVNVGVAADDTQMTLNRLNEGLIDGFKSRMVVLKIGTNDLALGKSAVYVSEQIGKILQMIKARLRPHAKIILLGILPRGGEKIHALIRQTNELIKEYADCISVHYLDMESSFATGLGKVKPQLYWSDQLHLSTEGYQVWAASMGPLFDQIFHGA